MTTETMDDVVLTPEGRETLKREIAVLRAAGEHPRVERLELLLLRATVVPPGPTGRVSVGSQVMVEDERGRRRTLSLVAAHQMGRQDAASIGSPIGSALLGRAPGTTVAVALPDGGRRALRIVAVD